MMTEVLRHGVIRPAGMMIPLHLCNCLSAVNESLNCLAVLRIPSRRSALPIVEVLADLVAREHFRRDQLPPRVSLPVAQIKRKFAARFPFPEFRTRKCNGSPRSSSRSTENEGMRAFDSGQAGVGPRPGEFLEDLAFVSATKCVTDGQHGDEKVGEKFGVHGERLSNETLPRRFLLSPNLCRQYFVRIYAKGCAIAESLANRKIFKRSGGAAHEAEETQPKGNVMLWTVFVVILILWLLGFIGHFGGGLIHLLLVVAVVVLIINLISGRRTL
jgi:hypothetical protein